MVAYIFFTGLIISLILLPLIKSWNFHYFFVFCLFLITSYLLSESNVLNDIIVYRDAFNISNKEDLYFEQGFVFFLDLVDQLNFSLVYSTTMALSATLTFVALSFFCSRKDFFSTFIFIALFANLFTLAWRQALVMPGVTFCFCFFVLYSFRKIQFTNLTVAGAIISSSFHSAGLVTLIGAIYRYGYVRYIGAILLVFFLVYFPNWSDLFAILISVRFIGSETYIDDTTYSSSRAFLVVCKFLALALIASFAWKSIKETTSSPRVLAFLLLFKCILAIAAIFFISPAWGRMLGILTFVDFVVLSHSLARFKLISFGYLLVSFAASTFFNPFYQ